MIEKECNRVLPYLYVPTLIKFFPSMDVHPGVAIYLKQVNETSMEEKKKSFFRQFVICQVEWRSEQLGIDIQDVYKENRKAKNI